MAVKTLLEPLRAVNFRARDEEIVRWKKAAYARRMSLSGWMRELLNAGCVDLPPAAPRGVVEHPAPPPVEERVAEEMLRKLAPVQTECLRRIAKGSFCKSCGRLH